MRLGLPRESALHWSAFRIFGMLAAIAGLFQKGPRLAWPIALAEFAPVAAFVSVSRGLARFVGKSPAWWPDAAVPGTVVLLGAAHIAVGMDPTSGRWRYPLENPLLLSAPKLAHSVGLTVLTVLVALSNRAVIFIPIARLIGGCTACPATMHPPGC